MKFKIKYFASLREAVNKSEEIVNENLTTALDVFNFVKKKYGLQVDPDQLKVAINEEYSSFDSRLNENDTIVFIPPVAGG